MKGIYIEKAHQIELKELPVPKLQKSDEALIKIHATGICGSDLSAYKGTSPRVIYPRVVGHELAGEIVALGSDCTGFSLGDHVVLEPYFSCGSCYACRKGIPNNCEDLKVLGVQIEGGMTEYITHPAQKMYKLPNDLDWAEAAMVEPLSIALHAVHRSKLHGSEIALVLGAGPIGLLTAQVCKAYGAKVILADILETRLQFARNLGIENTMNITTQNAYEIVRDFSSKDMAHVVFECSGAEASIHNALELAANSARICLVGWANGKITFNQPGVLVKELNIFGSRCSSNEFLESIELISRNRVNVKPMITVKHSLLELMQGFDKILTSPENYMKMLCVL